MDLNDVTLTTLKRIIIHCSSVLHKWRNWIGEAKCLTLCHCNYLNYIFCIKVEEKRKSKMGRNALLYAKMSHLQNSDAISTATQVVCIDIIHSSFTERINRRAAKRRKNFSSHRVSLQWHFHAIYCHCI